MMITSDRHFARMDIMEVKSQIVRKVGHEKAEIYFYHLKRYLSGKVNKSRFDKICVGTIGRGNIRIHNELMRFVAMNACRTTSPPPMRSNATSVDGSSNIKKIDNGYGYGRNGIKSGGGFGDGLTMSPRKGTSSNFRDRKFRERPSPLGPHGKTFSSTVCNESDPRTHSATELLSLESRPPVEVTSVEDGEEVEQMNGGSPSIQSKNSVSAPFGIARWALKSTRVDLLSAIRRQICINNCELPDTLSLKAVLEQKLAKEELGISLDCANVINKGLEEYLKRLIKPCIELARSREGHTNFKQRNSQVWPQRSGQMSTSSTSIAKLDVPAAMQLPPHTSISRISLSMLDIRSGVQFNPRLLGVDWPAELEKIVLRQ